MEYSFVSFPFVFSGRSIDGHTVEHCAWGRDCAGDLELRLIILHSDLMREIYVLLFMCVRVYFNLNFTLRMNKLLIVFLSSIHLISILIFSLPLSLDHSHLQCTQINQYHPNHHLQEINYILKVKLKHVLEIAIDHHKMQLILVSLLIFLLSLPSTPFAGVHNHCMFADCVPVSWWSQVVPHLISMIIKLCRLTCAGICTSNWNLLVRNLYIMFV